MWIFKSECDVCVLYASLRSLRPLFAVVSEPTDDFDAIEKCGLIVLFLKISWERMLPVETLCGDE